MFSSGSPDTSTVGRLQHETLTLARRSHSEPPTRVMPDAISHDGVVTDLLLSEVGFDGLGSGQTALRLRRLAALSSLIVGQLAVWRCDAYAAHQALGRAETHARIVAETTLRAQALVLRAELMSIDSRARDVGNPDTRYLLRDALALGQHGPPLLTCWLRFRLAWDMIASGEERDGLAVLEMALDDHSRALALPTPLGLLTVADGRWRERNWAEAYAGDCFARAGMLTEAERALKQALRTDGEQPTATEHAIWHTASMVTLANVHARRGDADIAAATLAQAWALNFATDLRHRQPRVVAARGLLPECDATHHLDEVMHELQ